MREKIYYLGVIIAFLGMSGFAEAITGRGSQMASVAWMVVGFIMCLVGYTDA